MNKIRCASQNMEAKILPADVCIFGHFQRLLPAAVYSTDCRFDSGVKWWIHIPSIVTYLHENSLLHWNSCKQHSELLIRYCFWSTMSKCDTHFEHSFLIDNVHAKWQIHCLLISSTLLLSPATSIYNWPKRVCGVFWVEQSPNNTYQAIALLEQ